MVLSVLSSICLNFLSYDKPSHTHATEHLFIVFFFLKTLCLCLLLFSMYFKILVQREPYLGAFQSFCSRTRLVYSHCLPHFSCTFAFLSMWCSTFVFKIEVLINYDVWLTTQHLHFAIVDLFSDRCMQPLHCASDLMVFHPVRRRYSIGEILYWRHFQNLGSTPDWLSIVAVMLPFCCRDRRNTNHSDSLPRFWWCGNSVVFQGSSWRQLKCEK